VILDGIRDAAKAFYQQLADPISRSTHLYHPPTVTA
jgi:hypothetical protein